MNFTVKTMLNVKVLTMANKKLEWKVYFFDVNKKEFVAYNIFNHFKFCDYLYKAKIKYLKKDNFRFEDFITEIEKDLMYCFWSKAEYELMLKGLPFGNIEEKIDIYQQVKTNWQAFTEYLYNNYKLIKKEK